MGFSLENYNFINYCIMGNTKSHFTHIKINTSPSRLYKFKIKKLKKYK